MAFLNLWINSKQKKQNKIKQAKQKKQVSQAFKRSIHIIFKI